MKLILGLMLMIGCAMAQEPGPCVAGSLLSCVYPPEKTFYRDPEACRLVAKFKAKYPQIVEVGRIDRSGEHCSLMNWSVEGVGLDVKLAPNTDDVISVFGVPIEALERASDAADRCEDRSRFAPKWAGKTR